MISALHNVWLAVCLQVGVLLLIVASHSTQLRRRTPLTDCAHPFRECEKTAAAPSQTVVQTGMTVSQENAAGRHILAILAGNSGKPS